MVTEELLEGRNLIENSMEIIKKERTFLFNS